jgi:hypothetical protein
MVSSSPLEEEPQIPGAALPPSSPPEGTYRADRRYLVGCVTGFLLGVALAVPGAYALLRAGAPASSASTRASSADTSASNAGAPANDEALATLLSVGLGALADNDPARALQIFQGTAQAFPASARVHNNICVTFNELSRYAEAVRHCELAITLDPALTLAQRNLQWAQDQLQRTSSASAAARK